MEHLIPVEVSSVSAVYTLYFKLFPRKGVTIIHTTLNVLYVIFMCGELTNAVQYGGLSSDYVNGA